MNRTTIFSVFFAVAVATVAGCHRDPEPDVAFEPNLVHAMKYQIKDDVPTEQASKDAMWVVTDMFGTPDEPKLPSSHDEDFKEDLDDAFAELLSMERLQKASGPFKDGRGLYRKHCANCHGVTGNGRGELAAITTPYPRDYRMGVFKFKSTKRSAKPTRSDLVKLIKNGIAGTPMKSIPELSDDDIEALTDYVIYLSIRGELERTLIDVASFDLDLEGGERVLDYQLALWIEGESKKRNPSGKPPEDYEAPKFKPEELVINGDVIEEDLLDDFRDFKEDANLLTAGQTVQDELRDLEQLVTTYSKMAQPLAVEDDEEEDPPTFADKAEKLFDDYEFYLDSWAAAEETAADLAASWLEATDDVVEVPKRPTDFPIAESYSELVKLGEGDQAETLAASVKRGQELFVGKIASCSKCHGPKGLGDGTTNDYDDWTKDWTTRAGLKPEESEKLIPLLARGALPPRNAVPRNFAEGIFRGGDSSDDLYRRIIAGIAGTPMPAATFVEGEFEQDDVWHIINFIRSLQTKSQEPASTKAPSEIAAESKVTAAL